MRARVEFSSAQAIVDYIDSILDGLALSRPYDVTAMLRIKSGSPWHNPETGKWEQSVRLTNSTRSAIQGPISLVLGRASDSARPERTSGVTEAVQPAKSPYVDLPAKRLTPGQHSAVRLTFDSAAKSRSEFELKVVAGLGPR